MLKTEGSRYSKLQIIMCPTCAENGCKCWREQHYSYFCLARSIIINGVAGHAGRHPDGRSVNFLGLHTFAVRVHVSLYTKRISYI